MEVIPREGEVFNFSNRIPQLISQLYSGICSLVSYTLITGTIIRSMWRVQTGPGADIDQLNHSTTY
jgi:hypothetical protein